MRQNRLLLGLSLRDAAEKAGVSKNTIIRMEAGLPVNWSTHVKVSRAYGRVPASPQNRQTKVVSGQFYCKQPLETRAWLPVRIGKDGAAEVFKNSEQIDQQERNRMGWYHLATHFISPLRCRREGSRYIAMITEIFAPTDVSEDVSGERFVLGLRGSVLVHVGSETFELSEGEAATIDSTQPTGFEPLTPISIGAEAPLLLHVVLP
ncbi:MAG: helix-turn-helix domain-containing protein [Armatimonadetes bacterium]|nr:helix-turn-helix domain-containing protein [Armatimonadota bacterium]MBS1703270.1 helix-turn-helix domain-containing protein [Armatimonadota bacterium]MBS1727356.1 helix-turn-helix domain-containing protein [Armatimonadota bacterium]